MIIIFGIIRAIILILAFMKILDIIKVKNIKEERSKLIKTIIMTSLMFLIIYLPIKSSLSDNEYNKIDFAFIINSLYGQKVINK